MLSFWQRLGDVGSPFTYGGVVTVWPALRVLGVARKRRGQPARLGGPGWSCLAAVGGGAGGRRAREPAWPVPWRPAGGGLPGGGVVGGAGHPSPGWADSGGAARPRYLPA